MNLTKTPDSRLSPRMLNLVKSIDPLLEKHGLANHRAQVGLILDWSGSMDSLYRSGQVQTLVERFVALGHRFDDDGQIDLYAYHTSASYIGTLSVKDCDNVAGRIRKVMGGMGGTRYSSGVAAMRDHTFGSSAPRKTPNPLAAGECPYYIGFVTDGANDMFDTSTCVEQFRSLSYEPAFIQCIALGDDYDPKAQPEKKGGWLGRMLSGDDNTKVPEDFQFLARLDSNVSGRYLDNASFFATVSPNSLTDEAFFGRMMNEYPEWLDNARAKGLVK